MSVFVYHCTVCNSGILQVYKYNMEVVSQCRLSTFLNMFLLVA